MSMHKGAEILASVAAAGFTSSTPTPISSPNTPAPAASPLQKIQAAAEPESLATAFTVVITASNGTSDTFTTAQTPSGRYLVSDTFGNVISSPT